MFNLFSKNPQVLLKEATDKRKVGDLENAIKLLRKAYQEISKGSTIYSVNTFLRLPLYLQKAKRNDEAWREFNLLLTKGYPNQINDPELIPMDHSIIYDKMRLFLQREGKNELAVRFGIFSYLSWAIGLYRQKRDNEFKRYTSRTTLKNTVVELLKKAKKEDVLETVCTIVEEQVERLPNIDFEELAKKLVEVLLNKFLELRPTGDKKEIKDFPKLPSATSFIRETLSDILNSVFRAIPGGV